MMMPSIFKENLFDEMMSFPWDDELFGRKSPLYGKQAKNLMKTDVKESDNGYELTIDLPGFKKEELSAELNQGYLTISAQKSLEQDNSGQDGSYIRRERYFGNTSRTFYVGENVTQEEIRARYEDGLLKLSIPKKEAKTIEDQRRIAIEG